MEKINKHAYLIMAHNDFYILEKNISLIDDYRNDIYIHVDKKINNFDFEYYKKIANKSNVYYVPRIDVRWGCFSQIQCEITLLKEATKKNYTYYHLISGVDLLLKTQDYIHNFFLENKGLEFLAFSSEEESIQSLNRIKYYYFFNKNIRNSNKIIVRSFSLMRYISLKLQKILKISRKWDDIMILKKGSQWFSITDDLAKYILEQEEWINEHFKLTHCGDELFLHTLVYNSDFKNKVFEINNKSDDVRFIDWSRGGPYVFRKEDFDELINSNNLFARKFSTKVDKEIIDLIYEEVKNNRT